MAKLLKNLEITSVDLCPQGANPDAFIKFYKSADLEKEVKEEMGEVNKENNVKEEDKMSSSFIFEKMEEEDQKTLKALMEKYGVTGVEEEPEEKKEDIEMEEAKKSADEVVAKAVELEEIKKELDVIKFAKSCVKYEDLGMVAENVAKKYIDLKSKDEDVAKEYITMLDERLKNQNESGIFKSFGKSGKGEPGLGGIERIAKEYMEKDSALTYEQAFTKAAEANPGLVEQYESEI